MWEYAERLRKLKQVWTCRNLITEREILKPTNALLVRDFIAGLLFWAIF